MPSWPPVSPGTLRWQVALKYLYKQEDKVEVLAHFHAEVVLKCLSCNKHFEGDDVPCRPILKIKKEIENLAPTHLLDPLLIPESSDYKIEFTIKLKEEKRSSKVSLVGF